MSGLLIVGSRFGAMPHGIKVKGGRSFVCGNFAVVTRRYGLKIESRQSNVILRQARNACSRNGRLFGTGSLSRSSIKANVDDNNVLRSPFPEIRGFTGTYVHEHIYGNLDKWHDKTALICSATGRAYTFAQMKKISGRLATSLRRSNLRPGDTIAAVLPNIPEYGLLLLAASEAGLRMTPINPAYTVGEIRLQIKASKASAVFTMPSKHSTVAASIDDNANVRLPIIVIEDGNGCAPEGTIKFADLISNDIEEFSKTGEKTGVDAEDTFLLPYSSGTSGLPKGVELSHRNLVANIMQLAAKGVNVANESTGSNQEIVPAILPFYHIYGLVVILGLHLRLGGKLVCVPQFTPDNFLKVLEENRSTLLYVAPPLVQLLANDERLKKHHVEAIKTVVSGAAPIGEEVLAKFLSKVPPSLKMVQGYGLTECAPVVSLAAVSSLTSAGHVVPNAQIRIVGYEAENATKNLGFDEVGEIYVRGPQIMKGYYDNPEATAKCMEGEWFKTGDLGCYDKSESLITGPLKIYRCTDLYGSIDLNNKIIALCDTGTEKQSFDEGSEVGCTSRILRYYGMRQSRVTFVAREKVNTDSFPAAVGRPLFRPRLIYIRGRLKELIKVQGFQVAPAEIEDLIQGYSKVADAAVIGVPHEKYGEIPKAFVVPKKGAALEANEIKEYVAERVAKYKRLGHVEFIDKIPKSAAGKILRRELEKM